MGRSPQPGRRRDGPRRRMLAAGVLALALAAAGCAGSSSRSTSSTSAPVAGGTAVLAEPPASTPDYIWPYTSSADFSGINTWYLQDLMYRPLYWFGRSGQPTVNNMLSLANPPTYNGTTVTITLKRYMWSDGTQVTAQNVMFWLNMELAEPTDYGGYTGFPGDVSDIKVVSPTELTMTMNKPYNPTWFLYNDLSQIVPMPEAWDRTASGPSSCSTTVADCPAVYSYLNGQAKDLSTYATSPIWGVVDGPWKLSAFNADGHITFVPNRSYSGPVKPKLAAFEEVPFTTDAAEYDVLQSPNGSTKIDVGYLPQEDAPAKPAGAAVGANPLASRGYTLAPWSVWGINYLVLNYQSTTGNAPVIRQLYFRQALADLMNQAAVLSGPLKGYGNVTVGPVASAPVTSFLSPTGRHGDPFPYNPSQARSLLASHGWTVVPDGVTTCADPSRCGAGIARGQPLTFTLPYATGFGWLASELAELQSNAASIGIRLNLEPKPFDQVTALVAGNCKVTRSPCNWDMGDWGGGWSFAPDYLPTGEELFQSGAVANSGGYSNPTNDGLIEQTLTSSGMQDMYRWQDYLATQLPVIWQPNADYQLTEVANGLKGVLPQSPTLSLTPEDWYFTR
jgi:peptide/nickel transport system substrate-binding protein